MLRRIIKIVFSAFVIWLLLTAFVFRIFYIPSPSMQASLYEGDVVLVNKLAYGARLPMTPLSFKINGAKKYLDWIQLPYTRLPGFSSVQLNDIVAFNHALTQGEPTDMQEEFVKRCLGLPGDSVNIEAGQVYVNAAQITSPLEYNRYHVVARNSADTALFRKKEITLDNISGDLKDYFAFMSRVTADSVSDAKDVISITPELFPRSDYHPAVYPNHPEFRWNYDYFGPLWIPKKGDSIVLSTRNLVLYQRCMEAYEKVTLSFKHDTVFINEKAARYYTFKMNYYFLLGDNRHNSIDSRAIGLIPEDHIIGKASRIF